MALRACRALIKCSLNNWLKKINANTQSDAGVQGERFGFMEVLGFVMASIAAAFAPAVAARRQRLFRVA